MMSRTQFSSTILAVSLLLPWNIAADAHGEPAPSATARGAGDRVVTRPMRAAGARTRSQGLGVRDASPQPHSAPAADGAVIIRPMTPVQESAAILMRLPPGRRIAHIAGFAGDIAAYGDARAAGAPGVAQVIADPESGLARGIERVRDRVTHRMKALRAAGGRIDAFTVEHPASLPPGPFGHMVLAEAVDAAVLEVFPRAEPPQRGEAIVDGEGAGTEDAGAHSEGEGGDAAVAQLASADSRPASRPSSVPSASTPVTEVPHWETAMQERGIDWGRIMDDTRQGAPARAHRRSG